MQQNFNVGFFSDCQVRSLKQCMMTFTFEYQFGDLDQMSGVSRGIYALEKQTCKLGLLDKLVRFECLLFDHEQDVFHQ